MCFWKTASKTALLYFTEVKGMQTLKNALNEILGKIEYEQNEQIRVEWYLNGTWRKVCGSSVFQIYAYVLQ